MTVNNIHELKEALNNGQRFKRIFVKAVQTPDVAGTPMLQCLAAGTPPATGTPSTAVAPNTSSTGAMHFPIPQGGKNSFLLKMGVSPTVRQQYLLIDLLSWQGGLSGTVATAQTTNLPTAALTRYTTGEGVMLGVACYTATGSTAANITTSYTNQAGTAGQVSSSVGFWSGGLGAATIPPTAAQIQVLPLATGDYGVRSVESVTLSASTLTAGNFGVFLFKPLALMMGTEASCYFEVDQFIQTSASPEILDEAFLTTIFLNSATGTITHGTVDILQV